MKAPKHLHYSGNNDYLAATGVDMVRYVGASHRSVTCDYVLEMFSRDNGESWTEPAEITKSWEKDGNLFTRAATHTFGDMEEGITIEAMEQHNTL